MGLGSGRRCGLRLAAAICGLREGFESGLAVSDGRGVPRRGGAGRLRIRRDGAQHRQRRVIGHGPTVREQPRPDPLDIRTGPVVPSGRSRHSGDPDSERRRSTWNLANPGARVSRTLRGPWEHEAHNAERPQSPALHQISRARNYPGLPLWRRRSSTGARLEHQWPVCHRLP